ncbi:MAG: cyclopropane fatty acyl phospholipid synthase [Desulfovibrionales bacterium]
MTGAEQIVRGMLEQAGVEVNGSRPWDIQVHDDHLYGRVLRYRNLGLGESYMEGWWDCGQLDEFFRRILSEGLDTPDTNRISAGLTLLWEMINNPQSRSRSSLIAEKHYNLGNDLFFSFLDPYHQYSCGYFNGTDDLNRAQERKLDLICRKLCLERGDHLLDIGCGWGGLARYAAERYGCQVTGVNISAEQIRHARAACKDLPVEILEMDYRDIQGDFDKIVSVGMFEHVGRRNYRTFMEVVDRCLKPDGIFLLHTIGGNESRDRTDPWISKYIFPIGMLPTMNHIGKSYENIFVLEDVHNLGPHYDRTLMAWHDNFQREWDGLPGKDEVFRRMWEYYLLSCAGAFRARTIQLWQLVFTKVGAPHPACRLV